MVVGVFISFGTNLDPSKVSYERPHEFEEAAESNGENNTKQVC